MARHEQQHALAVVNTAVELNDIAISLIERGCYRPAIATLRDAASIMKNHCGLQQMQTQHLTNDLNRTLPFPTTCNLGFVQSKLQIAAQRLRISQQTLETNKSEKRVCVVRVISEDECPAMVARSCANHGATRYEGDGQDQVFILIRPCRADMNEMQTTTTEIAAKTMVILYNYSIAIRCLGTTMTTTHCHRQKLEAQAFSILKIAFANTLNDHDQTWSEVKFNRALVLMFLMLHNLIYITHKLRNDLHFQQYLTCLHKLQHWINVLFEMQGASQAHASAA